VYDFCDARRAGKEPASAVTLFAFPDYFPAVATTDLVGARVRGRVRGRVRVRVRAYG